MNLTQILLAHFKTNGLTVYRSSKKVRMEKIRAWNDIKPTIGKVLSVSISNFRVDAFVGSEVKSLLLGETKFHTTDIGSPEEAEKLIGLNEKAKSKIESWKRARAWKQGELVEVDWNFVVEAYEYSNCHWSGNIQCCDVELYIKGENIIDVQVEMSDKCARITFKDDEGYIQTITDEFDEY